MSLAVAALLQLYTAHSSSTPLPAELNDCLAEPLLCWTTVQLQAHHLIREPEDSMPGCISNTAWSYSMGSPSSAKMLTTVPSITACMAKHAVNKNTLELDFIPCCQRTAQQTRTKGGEVRGGGATPPTGTTRCALHKCLADR